MRTRRFISSFVSIAALAAVAACSSSPGERQQSSSAAASAPGTGGTSTPASPGWHSAWDDSGFTVADGSIPLATSWGQGSLISFVRSGTSLLQFSGTNLYPRGGWRTKGGPLASDPSGMGWGGHNVDMVWRDPNNAVAHYRWDGQAWSQEPLGGAIAGRPTIVVASDGSRGDLFARAGWAPNQLWHRAWVGLKDDWQAWEPLPFTVDDDPAVVSDVPGRIELFYRAPNGNVNEVIWSGSVDGTTRQTQLGSATWTAMPTVGGLTAGVPAVASQGPRDIEIYSVAGWGDGTIWTNSSNTGGVTWSGWSQMPGALRSRASAVSLAPSGPGHMDLLAVSNDTGDLVHDEYGVGSLAADDFFGFGELGLSDYADVIAIGTLAAQSLTAFLDAFSGAPNPDDVIEAKLDALAAAIANVQATVDQAVAEARLAVAIEQQSDFDARVGRANAARAQATTAVTELDEWINSGKTNAALLLEADHDSSVAANTIQVDDTLFERPAGAGGTDSFDYRMATSQYVFTVAIRLGVIAAMHPNLRTEPDSTASAVRADLAAHAARLQRLVAQMEGAVSCTSPGFGGGYMGDRGSWVCSMCTDAVTGYWYGAGGYASETIQPTCEMYPLYGTNDQWLAQVQKDINADRSSVYAHVGLGQVMAMRDVIVKASHAWDTFRCGGLYPWFSSTLHQGDSLTSCNGRFTLTMQDDGDLVLYEAGSDTPGWTNTRLWSTNKVWQGGSYATMQDDGNFVLYDASGAALWATNTYGTTNGYLALQDDGNLVVYSLGSSQGVWSSGTTTP